MSLLGTLNNVSSFSVSVLRGGRGLGSKHPATSRPEGLLELYEFEACPYCKKVRETLSELNLEYISRSSARGSKNRAALLELGGKVQVPFLIDPNTDTALYESEDIIDYLRTTYAQPRSSVRRLVSPLNTALATIASAVRPRGARVATYARARDPQQLLELYNMEGSPYCRKVRETLCRLDLDCHIKNASNRGPMRDELRARGGKKTVPYLVDPNTDTEMYESDDIVDYLRATYG